MTILIAIGKYVGGKFLNQKLHQCKTTLGYYTNRTVSTLEVRTRERTRVLRIN
jgi:hypothetical protein